MQNGHKDHYHNASFITQNPLTNSQNHLHSLCIHHRKHLRIIHELNRLLIPRLCLFLFTSRIFLSFLSCLLSVWLEFVGWTHSSVQGNDDAEELEANLGELEGEGRLLEESVSGWCLEMPVLLGRKEG
jgi:hypothetical protein